MMLLDTSLGFDYWIDVLASVTDNPLDSIHNEQDLTEAIAKAFDKEIITVQGAVTRHLLFDEREPKWEILE